MQMLTAAEFLGQWTPQVPQEDLTEINTCFFYYCRNDCTFCIHHDKLTSTVGFSEESLIQKMNLIKEIIPKAKYSKILLVMIGGEIFTHVPKNFFGIYRRMHDELVELAEKHNKRFVIEFCTNLQAKDPTNIYNLLESCPRSIITTSYDESLRGNDFEVYKRNLEMLEFHIGMIVSLQTETSMEKFLRAEESEYWKQLYKRFQTAFETYIPVGPLPLTSNFKALKHMFFKKMAKDYPKTIIIGAPLITNEEFFILPQTTHIDQVKRATNSAESYAYSRGLETVDLEKMKMDENGHSIE